MNYGSYNCAQTIPYSPPNPFMAIIPGSPTFNALVQTRHDGVRLFKNVQKATTAGMPYNPVDYNLEVVHEPGTGYRCIALEGVLQVWPGRRDVKGRWIHQQKVRGARMNLTNLVKRAQIK